MAEPDPNKHLLVVAGPTGIGKTAVAINLALYYNTEIISFDSRQFYREMDKGTAKPSVEELKKVPHHFINSLSINEDYNAGKFEKDALKLLEQLFKKYGVVVAVGGSGLYMKALCEGIDEIPNVDPEFRDKWVSIFNEKGIGPLQDKLKMLDREYYDLVDRQNPQRLIRALEITEGTGKPFSSFRTSKPVQRPFKIHKIGLEMDREQLYERVEKRMDRMIEDGLFEEAKDLFPSRHLNALQTVGYSEIFDFIEEKYDREEAIRLLKRNSRRYAKRQMTWFRKDKEINWFKDASDILNGLVDEIKM